jgi:hypothetical protein
MPPSKVKPQKKKVARLDPIADIDVAVVADRGK